MQKSPDFLFSVNQKSGVGFTASCLASWKNNWANESFVDRINNKDNFPVPEPEKRQQKSCRKSVITDQNTKYFKWARVGSIGYFFYSKNWKWGTFKFGSSGYRTANNFNFYYSKLSLKFFFYWTTTYTNTNPCSCKRLELTTSTTDVCNDGRLD